MPGRTAQGDTDRVQEMMQARSGTTQAQPTPTDVVFEKFVLYVTDRAADSGSALLQRAVQPVAEDFKVIDASQISAVDRPDWLDGTPVVVDMREDTRMAHRGSAAVDVVRAAYPTLPEWRGGGITQGLTKGNEKLKASSKHLSTYKRHQMLLEFVSEN